MSGTQFERKYLFLYSNFRSTTQLYKYMNDFLGGVRGAAAPLDPPDSALDYEYTIVVGAIMMLNTDSVSVYDFK